MTVKKVLLLLFVLACGAGLWPACRGEGQAGGPHHTREAKMRIVVADTSSAVEAVTAAAEAGGGYLAASEVWREGEQLRARVTLRVPPAKLTPTLAAIRRVAHRVDSETVKAR